MSVVAITGVSGYLGQSLLSQLDLDEEVEAIVGVDRELLSCPPPDKLTFVQHDLTKPLGDLFADHGVTHAIHVATVGVREHEADPTLDLVIVGNVLDACGAAGARSVCVASSVIVYGAHPENTILLEGSIVRPNPELPAAATKLALEERCYDFVKAFPETALQIVRPCPILGPTARGLFTRILDAPRIYGPWRIDPRFQFVHEDDATRAIHRLVKSESFGVFNLAGDGSLTLSQIAQLAERRLVRLPSFLLRFAAWLAWRLGKTDLHPGLLPFLMHPWLVAAVKVRNSAYFVPRYDSADALLGYLEHREEREPQALEPFEWSAPTPAAKPTPAGDGGDFGQRPGLDAEDRAKTKPLGRPEGLEDASDLEELSRANDTPDPDSPEVTSSFEDAGPAAEEAESGTGTDEVEAPLEESEAREGAEDEPAQDEALTEPQAAAEPAAQEPAEAAEEPAPKEPAPEEPTDAAEEPAPEPTDAAEEPVPEEPTDAVEEPTPEEPAQAAEEPAPEATAEEPAEAAAEPTNEPTEDAEAAPLDPADPPAIVAGADATSTGAGQEATLKPSDPPREELT